LVQDGADMSTWKENVWQYNVHIANRRVDCICAHHVPDAYG